MAAYELDPSSYHEQPAVYQTPNPSNTTIQDNLDDEADETFSLSEFTIFGNNTREGEDEQPSKVDDESFEFFSEEWLKDSGGNESFPSENIVFCGNLIRSKQPEKIDREKTKVGANSDSVDKRKKYEDVAKRVCYMRAAKSRWYFYGVGLAGNPAKMDLGSIRSRQDRRSRTTLLVGRQGGGDREGSGGWMAGKGLWSLIKDLGCSSQSHANSMVKASLCIRRV